MSLLSGEMLRHEHLHRPLLYLVNRFSWHVYVPGFRLGDNAGETPRDTLSIEAAAVFQPYCGGDVGVHCWPCGPRSAGSSRCRRLFLSILQVTHLVWERQRRGWLTRGLIDEVFGVATLGWDDLIQHQLVRQSPYVRLRGSVTVPRADLL